MSMLKQIKEHLNEDIYQDLYDETLGELLDRIKYIEQYEIDSYSLPKPVPIELQKLQSECETCDGYACLDGNDILLLIKHYPEKLLPKRYIFESKTTEQLLAETYSIEQLEKAIQIKKGE